MAYPISDVTRRVVYTGSAGVGPYSFTFEVLANTDIQVYKNTTLLTLTTNYTVTINANGTGSVTLVVAATGSDTITIVGDRAIQRATDFVTGGDLFANTLNDEFDSLVIFAQQVDEKADRGLKAPVTDPTDVNMVLPVKATRLGTVLAFNATTGNPEAGPSIGSVTTVAAQSANINTVATNIASVNTVAGNSTNINTVAGVSSSVTTVAGISANVTSVAGNASNINIVAGNNANVTAVGTISSNVTTVAGISANVTTVAGISSNVTTVAGVSAAVTTNATNISSINTNATNIVAIQNASTNATNAAASAVSAGNAQTAAEAARDATLTAYDNFDDRYLGSKTSNPTLDNDGNALVAGSLYFNSVSGAMQVYTGSAWVAAYVSGTGFLASANNLSDVASTSSARTNLGLGTAAVVADSTLVHTSGNETIAGTKTFSAAPIYSSLTASSAVATDASKGLVSVTNTGTGNNVLATSPTIATPTITGDASISGLTVGKGGGSVSTNTAVGASALQANTGASNTAIGYFSGYSNTSGVGLVAVGRDTLQQNTTGQQNTAVGSSVAGVTNAALQSNTTGSYNIAVGSGALQANTTASNNTAVGYQAGYSTTTGGGNISIGYQSGYANTTSPYNIFIGVQAGYSTTGTLNTFIGNSATAASGSAVTTGTKNSIFGGYNGNQGGLDIRTASNYIVLSDGDGNPRGIFTNSGYLCIGGATTTTYNESLRINTAGQQGIHINDTTSASSINYQYFTKGSGPTNVGAIYYNGSTMAYQTTSDYRLKENVTPISNALATVAQLKPSAYRWKESQSEDTGFIAHELQQVFPQAVSGEKDAVDADGNPVYQGIDVSFLVATLTAAIQELKAIVDTQAAEIAELKAKVA
jgi:hypothetical protein